MSQAENVEQVVDPQADQFLEAAEEQMRKLRRGVAEIISDQELKRKIARSLREQKPLRIKLGLDPTALTSIWALR